MMTKKRSTHRILKQPRAVARHCVGLLLLLPSIEDSILAFRNTLSIAVLMDEMNILTKVMRIIGCLRLPLILVIQFHRSPSTFKGVF
jgi:arginine exporter protein ArgO